MSGGDPIGKGSLSLTPDGVKDDVDAAVMGWFAENVVEKVLLPIEQLGGVELLELGTFLVTGVLLEVGMEPSGEGWKLLAELDHGTTLLEVALSSHQIQPSPLSTYRVIADNDAAMLAIVVAVGMLDGGFPMGMGLQLLELGQAVGTLEHYLALVMGGT